MRIKKVVALLVVLIMLAASMQSTFAGYSDIPEGSTYLPAVERLASMGIMKGLEDGSFHPNDIVTREQFAAIMVNASGLSEMAKANSGTSVFFDVDSKSWSVGYINAAVNEGLITGFANGTFGPQDKLTLAQAATIVVKALGYTDQDITGVWPRNYIEKAKTLKLLDGIDFGYTAGLPRWAVAVMIDRLLSTEVKKKTPTEQPKNYAEASGLGVVKEYVIVSTGGVDPALASYKIRTDLGELTTTGVNLDKYIGYKVKLLFNSENKVTAVMSTTYKAKAYTVNSVIGNTIKFYDGEFEETIAFPDNLTMYYQGAKKNFKDIRNNIVVGSIISVAFNDINPNIFEYGVLVDPDMGSPIVARRDYNENDSLIGNLDISNKANLVVIKNGDVAKITDIKANDVIYGYKNPYSNKTYIFVYDKKLTGRYEEATPNKAAVNKIKIDGVTKEIETVSASRKLDSSQGAFNIGDRITVLLGKDGNKIVDVMAPYSSLYSNYAIILNTKDEISKAEETKGKKQFLVKLFKADGSTTGFIPTSSDYSALKGLPVTYELTGDTVEIQPLLPYNPPSLETRTETEEGSVLELNYDLDESQAIPGKVSGIIDRYNHRIGKTGFTDDAVLIDVIKKNNNSNNSNDATVKLLYWDELPSGNIEENKIIFAQFTGEFNDVQLLVFDNLTNNAGQYGLVTSSSVDKGTKANPLNNGKYTIYMNGTATNYTTTGKTFMVSAGDVVFMDFKDGVISSMKPISPYITSRGVQAMDNKRIKIDDKVYMTAPDLAIYQYSTLKNVMPRSISDIKFDGSLLLKLYFDNDPVNGGKVRIICIEDIGPLTDVGTYEDDGSYDEPDWPEEPGDGSVGGDGGVE